MDDVWTYPKESSFRLLSSRTANARGVMDTNPPSAPGKKERGGGHSNLSFPDCEARPGREVEVPNTAILGCRWRARRCPQRPARRSTCAAAHRSIRSPSLGAIGQTGAQAVEPAQCGERQIRTGTGTGQQTRAHTLPCARPAAGKTKRAGTRMRSSGPWLLAMQPLLATCKRERRSGRRHRHGIGCRRKRPGRRKRNG